MVSSLKNILFHPVSKLRIPPRWKGVVLYVLLLIIFWFIRYSLSRHFGLYEDDLTIIPQAAQMSFVDVIKYIFWYIVHLQGHSNPLHFSYIYLFSNIGWRLGGLSGIYFMGFLIESINICLLLWLVAKISDLRLAALVTLAYVLYSVDTTQAFLTLSLGVHPSITLLLLSFHFYLAKKRVLSYILAFLILFSYETPFPLFFAVPLLSTELWDKSRWRQIVLHGAIVSVMLISVIILRRFIGDTRVGGLGLPEMIRTPLRNIPQGMFVNLSATWARLNEVLHNLGNEDLILYSLGGVFLVLAFLFLLPKSQKAFPKVMNNPAVQFIIVGIIMMALGYTMAFTQSPEVLYGRATRVHTAASVGAAFFWGGLAWEALELFSKLLVRFAGIALIAMICAPLFGFGYLVQVDYARAWSSQRNFWSALMPLIPDVGPGDVVLVEPGIFRSLTVFDTIQIDANTWNMPRILPQLYDFTYNAADFPRVYRLKVEWTETILNEDGSFNLDSTNVYAPPSLYKDVNPSHVIFIQNNSGNMERVPDYFVIVSQNNLTVHVKEFDSHKSIPFSESLLFKLLIQNAYE